VLRINLGRGRKVYFFSPFTFLYNPFRGNPFCPLCPFAGHDSEKKQN
jgi:hypothetical protein